MSTEPPPPEDDPFRKQPPRPGGGDRDSTPPGGPYGGGPFGGPGDSYGAGDDPLAGMPPLAGSWRRTLARVVDIIIVAVVVGLVSWAVGTDEFDMDTSRWRAGRSFWQSLIAAVLYVAYDSYLIARNGQTLGKRWLRMRVANLANGANPSMAASLARAAVLWLPFAFCCACVWTAICGGYSFVDRPFKQGLHDKAARTVVVSTA